MRRYAERVQSSGSAVGANPVFQYYDALGHLAYHGDLTTWGYAPFPLAGADTCLLVSAYRAATDFFARHSSMCPPSRLVRGHQNKFR